MKRYRLNHEFVDYVPDDPADGVLYVSMRFGTTVHRCCCGCGSEIVAPLTPTDWEITFNGESVSLRPSIGSWSLPCQSHYWISRGHVRWARRMSVEEIEAGRARDWRVKRQYFEASASAWGSRGEPHAGDP